MHELADWLVNYQERGYIKHPRPFQILILVYEPAFWMFWGGLVSLASGVENFEHSA